MTQARAVPPGEGAGPALTPADAEAFERSIADGGVVLFPSDTVYGIATDPTSGPGFERLHELKRRSPDMPSAVMFFALDRAIEALPEMGARTRMALDRLLPGPLTLIVPNAERRYPLACGPEPERIGLRVPDLGGPLAALGEIRLPVLQSSANLHGGADPRRIEEVPLEIRAGVDLTLDGGTLPGVASTVVDLTSYESTGAYELLREGAFPAGRVAESL